MGMKVIVDDLLVNYEDEGKGKTVLMLHGWGTDMNSFTDLAERLQKKHRVVRLDFPGFGGSDKPRSGWTVGDYARFTRDFIEKLDLDVYALIAHSFGGRVTIKGVAEKELNPEKIILMGSAGIKPEMTAKKVAYQMAAKTGKAITSIPGLGRFRSGLQRRLYGSAGASDYLATSSVMRQVFINAIDEDLKRYAAQITKPSLLIWGEDDDSTPISDGKTLHQLIKKSELKVVPKAGHYVFLDEPETVTKKIEEFLS